MTTSPGLDDATPIGAVARETFWEYADSLIASCAMIVERPRGSAHPRYGDSIYPLDYGCLRGSRSSDMAELDVWLGSIPRDKVQGILCCVDLAKGDAEFKLLIGCSPTEIEAALEFCNRGTMRSLLVLRSQLTMEESWTPLSY